MCFMKLISKPDKENTKKHIKENYRSMFFMIIDTRMPTKIEFQYIKRNGHMIKLGLFHLGLFWGPKIHSILQS